jgi:hypothetical protein
MTRRRRIQILISVIVAMMMTFGVALFSFEFRGTELLRWSEANVSSSYKSTVDGAGYGWNCFGFSGFGWVEIEQDIVTPQEPGSSWSASTATMPTVPYWASAAELPVPLDDARFCPECRMKRVDGAFGWPLRVMAYRAESVWMANPYAAESGEPIAYSLFPTIGWFYWARLNPVPRLVGFTGDGLFPGRILWTGLIVNTAFFLAVLWSPFLFARAYRRVLEMRRAPVGACLKCGYDVAKQTDGSICPECGAAVTRGQLRPASTSPRSG